MSWVTEVVILLPYNDPDAVAEVNAWFASRGRPPLPSLEDAMNVEGKGPYCHLFAASLNHIGCSQLIDFLTSVAWLHPERVSILIHNEDDDRFRQLRLTEGAGAEQAG
jgi:hypothetical protein